MIDSWEGCYDDSWAGLIVPDAFSHPAKFSRGLIHRIYQHAKEQGWIHPGDVVLDCFGGCALGGIDAMWNGLYWIGCELEQDFVIMGKRNINLWSKEVCTCHEDPAYLCELRDSVSTRIGRSKPEDEAKDGTVLSEGMQQHLFVQGEEINRGSEKKLSRSYSLEQGKALERSDNKENHGQGKKRKQGKGKKRTLEGRGIHPERRLCDDSGERKIQDETRLLDGTAFETPDDSGGNCSPQERRSTGQQDRESSGNDDRRTHEASPSKRDTKPSQKGDLSDLSENSYSPSSSDYLQPRMQTSTKPTILEETRFKEKVLSRCEKCGKHIVYLPRIIQGDSRKIGDVMKGAGIVVSSPPFMETGVGGTKNVVNKNKQCVSKNRPSNIAKGEESHNLTYGHTPGNLANLREGDIGAVIGSPPFSSHNMQPASVLQLGGRQGVRSGYRKVGSDAEDNYGHTPGNLANLREGDIGAVIGSPPFCDVRQTQDKPFLDNWCETHSRNKNSACRKASIDNYGTSHGQLGAMKEGSPPERLKYVCECGYECYKTVANDDCPECGCAGSMVEIDDGSPIYSSLVPSMQGDVAAVISSPAYPGVVNQGETIDPQKIEAREARYFKNHPELRGVRPKGNTYGHTKGNISNLTEGDVAAIVKRDLDNVGNHGIMLRRKEIIPCQNAKHAESKSLEEVDGANPALTSTSAKSLKERENLKDMANTLRQLGETDPLQSIGDQPINDGKEEASDGGVMLGGFKEEMPLSVTGINAVDVEQQIISRSTTKKMRGKRGGCGTTPLKISKHCAGDVILGAIEKQSIKPFAPSAGSLMQPEAESPVVQKSVQENHFEEHGKSLTQKNNDPISASSVEKYSRDTKEDGNIAEMNVLGQPGQHGKETTDQNTFWEASKIIVQGCFDLLRSGGISIWVCKDYIKAKKRVPFSDRWLALCESIGFRLVCRHQAMLVKHHGDQCCINGDVDHIETRRISFFRRLAESKGSPKIEWEDILCLRKD